MLFGPIQVHNPKGILIGSAVFVGLTSVTDRQTDRQTDRPRYSVCNNRLHTRIYVRSRHTAMRPNKFCTTEGVFDDHPSKDFIPFVDFSSRINPLDVT